MQATTSDEFRVLDVPQGSRGSFTLVSLTDLEPTLVEVDVSPTETSESGEAPGAGPESDALAETVDGLRPGYVVDATLSWDDGTARFAAVEVTSFTLIEYAQAVSGLFEAALDTMEEARREGLGITGRPTYSTDGEPNGAVYAFAEQRGERDVFEEIRNGSLPLEPLIDRLESTDPESGDNTEDAEAPADHEIFVFRPVEHDYILVYLVRRRDSLLADTVRDTYDCPRPTEPLR